MKDIIRNEKRQKLNRPITGIIQEDRIWEQWYDQKIFSEPFPKMSQKDYLFKCIEKNPTRVMIDNRGLKKYTVAQFKEMVLAYEKAFFAMRLSKGDVICTIALTTPEMYAIKYSATSLGLITCNLNFLDVGINDAGKNRLFRQLENVEPKMIFTLDILEEKVYSVVNDNRFSKAIKVSMPLEKSTSLCNPERVAVGLKLAKSSVSKKVIHNKISLAKFLSFGNSVREDQIVEIYEENLPCNISFTSGTTGINKAVLLSHDANNALAYQQKIGGYSYSKGGRQLALVPPFLAFWDSVIVHSGLSFGGENIIELFLDYNMIPKYFKKHDVNLGVWTQYLWSSILTLPKKDLKKACKNLRHVIIGGERCEINAAEAFYNKTGIIQMTGFGASEVNTAFSVTHPYCNKVGTSGIPLPLNNVKIVDESFKDVTYGIAGKLYITGPGMMNGYYRQETLTRKAIYVDKEGVSWYNTGDYAVIDDDGCLTVLDRYTPPVEIVSNGQTERVNMLDIVEIVKKNRSIKNSKMTYHSGKLVLHISLDSFSGLAEKEAIDSILTTIRDGLPEKYWPDIIALYDELPRTSVGKVKYNQLNLMGAKLCKGKNVSEKLCIIRQE